MYKFKQCALSRTPHPDCGHTHVPSSSTPSHTPLTFSIGHFSGAATPRCSQLYPLLSAVPAAHPLAAALASAVAPAALLYPLRPLELNGQRVRAAHDTHRLAAAANTPTLRELWRVAHKYVATRACTALGGNCVLSV